MNLITPSIGHIRELMLWFPDAPSVNRWGGPSFRFPFTEKSFLQDVHWDRMATYVLVDADDTMVGFGQLYEKERRAHLARLAVAPALRRRGLGQLLIEKLLEKAQELLPGADSSLYVLRSNEQALRCYLKLGFQEAPFPASDRFLSDLMFMVRKAS